MYRRAVVLIGLFTLLVTAPAQAATFTVNSTTDPVGASGCTVTLCTIRTAIAAAAANGSTTDDIVDIPAGTYTLTTGLGALAVPASATRITISGAGANTTFVQAPAASGIRVLSLGSSAGVTISNLTLRNGNVTQGNGGNLALSSFTTATLSGVRVAGGSAPRGGGIATAGSSALTISKSLIDSNVASGTTNSDLGGGLYVEGQTSATAVTIQDSTFTANRAQQGGAIGVVNNTGQNPILRGVTIARNTARGNPGIAGVYSVNTTARFQGSILSENTYNFVTGSGTIPVTTNCALASAAIDDGGNLESATDCGLAGHQSSDPLLAASLDTSQPPALALGATSPAIDIAACGARVEDQRGVPRPQGATCDAGAYERDAVVPNTTITGGPAGPTSDTTPTFSFTSTEAGTFECRIDAAAFSGCSSPFTPAALGEGPHTFEVRAIDLAGNVDASPATRPFTVDTTPPDTTISGGPSSPTNDTTPTFVINSSEPGSTFECRVDAGSFGSCFGSYTPPALGEGPHTIFVRAIDLAFNVDPTPATRSFSVDTTAPDTTITAGPNGPTNDNTPTFSFNSEAGASFECRVDALPFAACTSSFTTAALATGAHTFAVRAIDTATNVDGTPATRAFTVDTAAPDTTITGNPPAATSDNTPTFTFTSTEAGTFECRVDAAAFATCASPYTTAPLTQGQHVFDVRAIDSAGNVDATPATHTFTMDATPPETTIAGAEPTGSSTDHSPVFTFSSPDATATFECSLDGGAFAACTSPKAYAGLTDGAHIFAVRAIDALGNVDATPSTRLFALTTLQVFPQPTPTPGATPTPAPSPAPKFHQSVVVAPGGGTVLVRVKGATKFEPLDVTKGIPLGSEVDARKGKVVLTSVPKAGGAPETATFYDGLFIVNQIGDITELRLSEKLTGCRTSKKQAAAAAKKPKTRKLWGDGKGKFRTRGQYSAATIRGTKWLVQDTCTTTLTRVAQGVVSVNDFVKKKTVLVKKGKRYTARAKR